MNNLTITPSNSMLVRQCDAVDHILYYSTFLVYKITLSSNSFVCVFIQTYKFNVAAQTRSKQIRHFFPLPVSDIYLFLLLGFVYMQLHFARKERIEFDVMFEFGVFGRKKYEFGVLFRWNEVACRQSLRHYFVSKYDFELWSLLLQSRWKTCDLNFCFRKRHNPTIITRKEKKKSKECKAQKVLPKLI